MGWRKAAVVVALALLIAGVTIVGVSPRSAADPAVGPKTITVDGDPSDWTGVPGSSDAWVEDASEFIWNDAVGDDTGDGDYTYPKAGDLNRTGLFDIQEVRFTADSTNLYVLVKIVNLSNAWSGSDGFSTVAGVLLIDTTKDANGSLKAKPNVNISSGSGWEYYVKIAQSGWHAENAKIFDTAGQWAPITNKANVTASSIEASIPLAFIGKDGYSINGATWRFMFFLGGFCGECPTGFREVKGPRWGEDWSFGGGHDGPYDPEIIDMAFAASTQTTELGSYNASTATYATISSSVDVNFGSLGFTPDTTAPTISNVTVTPTFNSAQIVWDTDEIADTTVLWDGSAGSLTKIASRDEFVTSHSITLTGLQELTTYYYRLVSYDIAGNGARTAVLSFTTGASPPSNLASWVGNTFVWQDAAGDDVGDGDYTYPLTSLVKWPGRADIGWLNMSSDGVALHISATVNAQPEAEWRQRMAAIAVFIDKDHVVGSGARWVSLVGTGAELTDPHPMNLSVAPDFAWEYMVVANFQNRSAVGDPSGIGEMLVFNDTWNPAQRRWTLIYQSTAPGLSPQPNTGYVYAHNGTHVDIYLNYSVLGSGDNWTYVVAGMIYDDAARPFEEGGIRQVRPTASDWIGGGSNGPFNPNVYDLAFYPDTASQIADLSLYSPGAYANLTRAMQINFSANWHQPLFIPDLPGISTSLSVSTVGSGESSSLTAFVTNRGVPVEGASVSLAASPTTAVDIISANPTTTNAFGAASFTVRGKTLEADAAVTLTVTATVGVSTVDSVLALTVKAVGHAYTLSLAVADGVLGTAAQSTVTASFRDKGVPISGASVNLSSGNPVLTVLASPATTNAQGQATFTIRAGYTETDVLANLTARATNATVETVATTGVTVKGFVHVYSLAASADVTIVEADGMVNVTFTFRDVGAARAGASIAISISPSAAMEVVGDALKTTGPNGQAVFTLRAKAVTADTSVTVTGTASNGTAQNVATLGVTLLVKAEVEAVPGGVAPEVFWTTAGILAAVSIVLAMLWLLGWRPWRPKEGVGGK